MFYLQMLIEHTLKAKWAVCRAKASGSTAQSTYTLLNASKTKKSSLTNSDRKQENGPRNPGRQEKSRSASKPKQASQDAPNKDAPRKHSEAEVGMVSVKVREISTPEIHEEDDHPYPRPFLVHVTLQGKSGFEGPIESGSSHTLVGTHVPHQIGTTLRLYKQPCKMTMAVKGSRAKILHYIEIWVELVSVKRRWRMMVAPITEAVLIGRDFLRAHKMALQFNPDRIVAHDPTEKEPSQPTRGRKRRHANQNKKPEAKQAETEPAAPAATNPSVSDPARANAPMHIIAGPLPEQSSTPERVEKAVKERPTPALLLSLRTWGDNKHYDYEPSTEEAAEFEAAVRTEFRDVLLSKTDLLPLAPEREITHIIEEKDPNKQVVDIPAYPVPAGHRKAHDEMIDEQEVTGCWVSTSLPSHLPTIPKLKKDGKAPLLQDMRKMNENLVSQVMPPMNTEETIGKIATSHFVSEADATRAFDQMLVRKGDEKKNILSTIRGNYMCKVARQGNKNSPVMLHQMCHKHKWYLSEDSLKICPPQRDALGRKIWFNGLSKHPNKTRAILNYVAPTDTEGVRKFLGLVGYEAPFIPNLSIVAAPLMDLTGSAPLRWSHVELRGIIEDNLAPQDTYPVHRSNPPAPDDEPVKNDSPGDYFFLFSDACNVSCGSMLAVGKNWWSVSPIAYGSKKWNAQQAKWSTYCQELQGIVNAVKKHAMNLTGLQFTILVDNKATTQLFNQREMNLWQLRAYEYLSQFNLQIRWIEGAHNEAPDALSHQYMYGSPEHEEDEEDNFDLQVDREIRMLDREVRFRQAPTHWEPHIPTPKKRMPKRPDKGKQNKLTSAAPGPRSPPAAPGQRTISETPDAAIQAALEDAQRERTTPRKEELEATTVAALVKKGRASAKLTPGAGTGTTNAVPVFPIDTFYPELPEAPTTTMPDAESPPPPPPAVSDLHISNTAQLKTIFWKEDPDSERWDDGTPRLDNFITRMTGGTVKGWKNLKEAHHGFLGSHLPLHRQESDRDCHLPRKRPVPCSHSRSPLRHNCHYHYYSYGHAYDDLSDYGLPPHPDDRYQHWSGADAPPFNHLAYYAPQQAVSYDHDERRQREVSMAPFKASTAAALAREVDTGLSTHDGGRERNSSEHHGSGPDTHATSD
ncbi:hypothetical protein JCM1840_006043 [Sporobolomyces johnsonii]